MIFRLSRKSLCLQNVEAKVRFCFHHGSPVSQCKTKWLKSVKTPQRFFLVPYSNKFSTHAAASCWELELLSVSKHAVGVCCVNRRSYSDFKDDELVKSWIKEIRDDFEKTKPNENESMEEPFKDIENAPIVGEEKQLLKNSENLTPEEAKSFQKLEQLAIKFSGVEKTETDSSSSDSDSDLLSSESDSDSSDNETIDKSINSQDNGTVVGLTKEEMIELLEKEIIKDNSDSDTDATNVSDEQKQDAANESPEDKTSPARNLAGVAASRVGRDGTNEDWGVVEIEDFVNIQPEPEVESPWVPPISLQHGKTGVFDVEELVTLLDSANTFDVVVVRLPREAQLGDYMVIASCKSVRHITAVAKDVQWIYKRRVNRHDGHLRVEGEKTNWQALDIGNIFLHLFLPEVREQYDLETLWTVGPAHDEKCRDEQATSPYVFTLDDLPWLRDLEAGRDNSQTKPEPETDTGVSASKKHNSN